jgi:hypothetical protein
MGEIFMSRFITAGRETIYLLPPSVSEWLPEGHLARFVAEVMDQLATLGGNGVLAKSFQRIFTCA